MEEQEGAEEELEESSAGAKRRPLSQRIKPSTSFIELNIDSLLTLNIISKLSEEIEIDLLRNLLTDNNSMDKV